MMPAKKTPGRTPAAPQPPDDDDVGMAIKVSAEEHAAFKAAAEASGLSLAAWTRQALRAVAGLPTFSAPINRNR